MQQRDDLLLIMRAALAALSDATIFDEIVEQTWANDSRLQEIRGLIVSYLQQAQNSNFKEYYAAAVSIRSLEKNDIELLQTIKDSAITQSRDGYYIRLDDVKENNRTIGFSHNYQEIIHYFWSLGYGLVEFTSDKNMATTLETLNLK